MKNIARVLKISKPLHPLIIGISVLIIIISLLGQVSPILSKLIVDEIQKNLTNEGGDLNTLYILIAITFFVTIFASALDSIKNRLGDHLGGKMRKFLTEKFYDHIMTLPQSYFDSELSGKIVNQLNRGIATIQQFFNVMTNFIVPSFLQAIFTIAILFYYSPIIAILTASLFPVYIYLSYYSTVQWGKKENEKNELEDLGRGRISEVIMNMRLVKAYLGSKREYDYIKTKQNEINAVYAKQSSTFHKIDFLRNLSLNIILTGINIIVFYNTFQGVYSIGELVLIIQLVNQVRWPLYGMSFILTQIQMTESGSKEYFEILDLPRVEDYDSNFNEEKLKNPSIEFKNVGFKYEKGDGQVLGDISFKINKDEKVALIGHSGAGKSTIINLILKFYNPTSGEIFLKDKNYKELSHNEIRNNISLVFQENELFSSTIKENVSYGIDATDEEVIAALKKANAWGFVEKLKKGIDSEVGERGVKLSGGQKQRIQIARAIIHDNPIVILDEATSSLDSKSEHEVQEALENLMKDRIVIIIAHRFSTIQNVDRILVLGDGKLLDSGTPKELSSREGVYKELLQYQIEGDKKLLANFEMSV